MSSASDDPKWKVRNVFFQAFSGSLTNLLREVQAGTVLMSPHPFMETSEFIDFSCNPAFREGLKTEEDVDRANSIIDKTVAGLEKGQA